MTSLFSTPKITQPKETPNMPAPNDEAVAMAKRKAAAQQAARTGRASTFMSGNTDKLGG